MLILIKAMVLQVPSRTSPTLPLTTATTLELRRLSQRIRALVEGAAADGTGTFAYIAMSLQREENWERWKFLEGCRRHERAPEAAPSAADADVAALNGGGERPAKRRRRERPGAAAAAKEEPVYARYQPDLKALASINAAEPKVDEHFEFLEMCLEPDSGVLPSELPTREALFAWQARRLLMHARLDLLDAMPRGDVLRGLRRYRGGPEEPLPPSPRPAKQAKPEVNAEPEDGEMVEA
ncbi:hypothetical protein JKP88DRAFT_237428 [Tribonema minus]|uniref:Uncharacterized protein n=1 Tax=Tribonema minus TaxID=303371 RepID=A0A836CGT6_9STRA|nr:hypothetical protein JKP88DRAFT_237428 [Tribonema minus]